MIKLLARPSAYWLLLANLATVVGVLFFNWNVFYILFLYWFESAAIGFFNILKIIKIDGYSGLPRAGFFLLHYGMFMFVHLIFIFGLFGRELFLGNPNYLQAVINSFQAVFLAILAVFISHGMSYYQNFIKQQEYKVMTTNKLMQLPYKRIVVMHITIIMSGFVAMFLGQPKIAILIMVILKILIDVRLHNKEHGSLSAEI